jgi:ribonuclease J
MEKKLSVIPLGGVEEVGLNMTVLEFGDDIMVIDAGLMFPEEDMLGVDFVIPDMTYIRENKDRVRGIVLTHGHEDHTGALPFLMKEINVPVFGTPLTLGLVKHKLAEHRLDDVKLVPIKPRDIIDLGVFVVEFIRVLQARPHTGGRRAAGLP